MKKLIITVFLAVLGFSLAAQVSSTTPKGFTDDLDAALVTAKKTGKTVYAVFSGSDWCYWCKVLDQGYLSKPEFVKEASKKFVLVFIDRPQDQAKLSEKARARNPELLKKYGIRGFPTTLFIGADGKATRAPRPGKDMTPKAYAESLAVALEK